MKKNIKDYNLDELKNVMVELGEKPFRAEQIFKWIFVENVTSFDEMTNIPTKLRDSLNETCRLVALEPIRVQTSQIDQTQKYLFKLFLILFYYKI